MTTSKTSSASAMASNLKLVEAASSNALTSADSLRADTLHSLSQIHQAKLSRLTRLATAAQAQSGADSAQASAAHAVVQAAQLNVARLLRIQQLTTPTPAVAAKGWTLHGRVYDSTMQPLGGYSVFLVDAQKAYLRDYGFSYTDDTGYFLLNYAGPASVGTEKAAEPTAMYMEVVNAKSKPVYLNSSVFEPATGSVTYQSVVLPLGQPVLGALPADVRQTAMPGAESKTTT